MIIRYGLLSVALSVVFIMIGCKDALLNNDESVENHPTIFEKITLYPIADNIERFSLIDGVVEGIKFEVKERYPARNVLSFYEIEMNKLNYIPYIEENCMHSDRKWQRFVDSTKKGSPYVAQLTADWTDQKKTIRIKLILNYYWKDYEGSSDLVLSKNEDLVIIIQKMPFSILPCPVE